MRLFKCDICGNLVDLLEEGGGTLVCCGEEMTEIVLSTEETTFEKHIPVVTKEGNNVRVQVGSTIHPMLDNHYINFIVLVENGMVMRKDLKPGEEPVATFTVTSDNFEVYAYCNIHGFYKA